MEERCFIAIELSEKAKKKVYAAARTLERLEGVRLVDPENLHLTLKFLGEVGPDKIESAIQLLGKIKRNKFKVTLTKVGAFPNKEYIRVVWIGCVSNELEGLGKQVNDALSKLFKPESFAAHLTIARVSKKISLEQFFTKYEKTKFGEFEVDRFYLKSSVLGKEGPVYENLKEYVLG
ncbi:RNA 2',3'-cyclic phosphodiesterase [Candidatus Micrarchaeota archaeon]|nr:RNA 2',3'-cyclic phosphodiesterase [Candidatus Micrarchaeota archaeon]